MESEPFGEALRRQRLQVGLSQRALAGLAGVSERSVRNVEHGAVRPQPGVAKKLADAVGLDRSVLPASSGVRLGVLGPLVVEAAGAPVEVGPAKQRTLLGLLAVQPGIAVGTAEIVDALWADDPPNSCLNLVHTYSSRLRRALEEVGGGVRIVSTSMGYRLLADGGALDLWQFQDLTERARKATTAEGVLSCLEAAVDCWRGPVLADLPEQVRSVPAVPAVRAVLRKGLAAAVRYADVALPFGRCDVDRVQRFADLEPLHEGVHARLMLALAADGQQAAALRVYNEVRRRLRDDLGVDPSADLQEAQLRVLRGERLAEPARVLARPAELPADVSGYVGRAGEMAALDDAVAQAQARAGATVVAVDGMPGVGKTALSVHWAHRVARHFPDGQLYVNLRGYDRTLPLRPHQALARFLRALGVAADRIPADEDEAASLYRSLLAERRILVVLDNARSMEQVEPLLPGGPSCFTVVTGRERLTGLAAERGARLLTLDVLESDEARGLITSMIATRQDVDAVDALARICGYLPLVLRVAAADIAGQRHSSAEAYAAALRERGKHAGSDAVRAAFDVSFERLQPRDQEVFPLLGLAPGDFTAEVVATLADCGHAEADDVLQRLCTANLLQRHAPGRYRLHDLLREYAVHLAGALPSATREASMTRMLEYYLGGVYGACRLLYPQVQVMDPPASTPAEPFPDERCALEWLDAERLNLLDMISRAADLDQSPYAWRLIDALRGFLWVRGWNHDGIVAGQHALAVARRVGDKRAEAHVLDALGLLHFNLSDYPSASESHTAALAIGRDIGDGTVEAMSLHSLGRVCSHLGLPVEAAEYYELAIDIRRRQGDAIGEASSLNYLGVSELSMANLAVAKRHVTAAYDLARRLDNKELEVRTLHSRGLVSWAMGELDAAVALFVECLSLARAAGSSHCELAALLCMAEAYTDMPRFDLAADLAGEALTMARTLGERRQEVGGMEVLAVALAGCGRREAAEPLFREALTKARDIGFAYGEVSIQLGLATVARAQGRAADAVASCVSALTSMERSSRALLASRAHVELGLALADVGDHAAARTNLDRAAHLAEERGQHLVLERAKRAIGDLGHPPR